MKGKIVKRFWEGGFVVMFEFVFGDLEFFYISIDLVIGIDLLYWFLGVCLFFVGVKSVKV